MSKLRQIKKRVAESVNFPAWCAEAWAMHQIFRGLGLSADDLYIHIGDTRNGKDHVHVTAREGELTFTVSIGPGHMTPKEIAEHWQRFIPHMNRTSDAERRAVAASTKVWKELSRLELILKMIDKGFTLPKLPAEDQAQLREWRRKNLNQSPPPAQN